MISPLADARYRRLFAAQAIALGGTGLTSVALALLAWDLANGEAGVVLGTALAIKMAAYVTVAPLAGAVAHRLPRRGLLVAMDGARAGVVLCLPLVSEVWHVYGLILVLSACSAAFTPTYQATIPDLLPDEARYTRALTLSRLAYDLENLLSPAAAALALTMMSYDGLFAANGLTFLVSGALIAVTPLPRPAEPAAGDGGGPFSGLRRYLATPRLRGLLALSWAAAAGGAMVIVNTVVYVRQALGGSEAETAIALAAAGGGSMVAAIALPRLLDILPPRPVMVAGGVLIAVALAMAAMLPAYGGLLALWALIGAGSSLIQTPAGRLLAISAHPPERPALYAAQFALSHGAWLAAYVTAGWLGKVWGLGAASTALAAVVAAGTAASLLLWPAREAAAPEHDHPAQDHEHLHVHDDHHRHEHEGWEGPEPHAHPHSHGPLTHRHPVIIDAHHPNWPA